MAIHRHFGAGVLIAAISLLPACAGKPATQPLDVSTDSGPVRGVTADGIQSFKGIPFAQAPVGDLRWRAPQPVTPWTEPKLADQYGHDCMQLPFPSDAAPLGTEPSEDCLVLNVWRPEAASDKPLPVIAWIYGGGFVNGGASPAVYDGSAAARRGVVFVSFNYRLGRFGFFAHPALSAARPEGEALGNYGYMDQLAAMRWIQRNVAAFGGDPSNVTVIGESAGGGSVHMLLTSPEAQGLFKRAVVQSGGGRGSLMGPRHLDESRAGVPSAQQIGQWFAESVGITGTDAATLAALRALSGEQVVAGMNLASMRGGDPNKPTYSGPMVDGSIVTNEPEAHYRAGTFNKADLMVGATSADIGFGMAESKDALFASFGAGADAARKAYDPDGTRELQALVREVFMDRIMGEPARHAARLFTAQKQAAYLYRFSYVAESMRGEWKDGAPHASDIPFFFDTVKAKYGEQLTAQDSAMSAAILDHLVAFARDGKPEANGRPWPAYDAENDGLMDFGADGKALWGADPWQARLDATAAAAAAARP
jgi:para-nitrobenzyl esterase